MNGSEYKDVFLTEAREYLSTFSNALLVLERDPSQTEPIREIFRAAHTLKGMSATMGYEPMARLTHQMETVLEPVRFGTMVLSTQLVDALFVCMDLLEKWLQLLSNQDFIEDDSLLPALQLLEKFVLKEPEKKEMLVTEIQTENMSLFTDSELDILSEAKRNGFSIIRVMIELDPECVFKQARSFMILRCVNELGEIVKSFPSPEDIEKGNFGSGFSLVIVTDQEVEKFHKSLFSIGDVKNVQIETFEGEKLHKSNFTADPSAGVKSTEAETSTALGSTEGKIGSSKTVRVQTSKLDKLMALVQELVISKVRFEQITTSNNITELSDPLSQLNHITDELQDEIMKVRLMPVKQIFERFPRMVRALSKDLNKQVDLEMEGADVELDRTVLEEMSEPLVHLLRNAVDHGIETSDVRIKEGKESYGVIRLEAKRERSFVVITITDDGRGVDSDVIRQKAIDKGFISIEEAGKLADEEIIRLIFLPGFSTAEKTTEISGRGVGLDVAKTKVEALGGTFKIQSKKGLGTTFILKFPLTLAIIKALLVRSKDEIFAVPVVAVLETVDIQPSTQKRIQQQETIVLRGEVIPLYDLWELLDLGEGSSSAKINETETILIVEVGESRVAIKVDEVLGQQEIAIKSLDRWLKGIRGFSGATILGNGKIALILEMSSLIEDLKERRFQEGHSIFDKDNANVT